MSFWDEKVVTARKAHKCEECLKEIAKGERYTRGSGINVCGEFGCWVTHTDCLAAIREQMELGECPGDEWWSLHEVVWDMDPAGLRAFALDYPAVYERFREELEEHDRAPLDHFVWDGAHPQYVPQRRDWYRWTQP